MSFCQVFERLDFNVYVGNRRKTGMGFPDLPHRALIHGLDKTDREQPGQRAGVNLAIVNRSGLWWTRHASRRHQQTAMIWNSCYDDLAAFRTPRVSI